MLILFYSQLVRFQAMSISIVVLRGFTYAQFCPSTPVRLPVNLWPWGQVFFYESIPPYYYILRRASSDWDISWSDTISTYTLSSFMINVMNTQDSAYNLVDLVVFQFGVIVRYSPRKSNDLLSRRSHPFAPFRIRLWRIPYTIYKLKR